LPIIIVIKVVVVREVLKLYKLLDGFTLHEEARGGGVPGLGILPWPLRIFVLIILQDMMANDAAIMAQPLYFV